MYRIKLFCIVAYFFPFVVRVAAVVLSYCPIAELVQLDELLSEHTTARLGAAGPLDPQLRL